MKKPIPSFPRKRESSEKKVPRSGQNLGSVPVMEQLAIRLSWQKNASKVAGYTRGLFNQLDSCLRGNDGVLA